MPSDEDFKFLSSFLGCKCGQCFYKDQIIFGIYFLVWSVSPISLYQVRIKSVPAPYLYNRICYGLGTDLIWTGYGEGMKLV